MDERPSLGEVALQLWQTEQTNDKSVRQYADRCLANYRRMILHQDKQDEGPIQCPENSELLVLVFVSGLKHDLIQDALNDFFLENSRPKRRILRFNIAVKKALTLEEFYNYNFGFDNNDFVPPN